MLTLLNRYCVFASKDKAHSRFFQLAEDGEIHDIDSNGHDNERFWDFKNNKLMIYNDRNIRTSIYTLNEELSRKYDGAYYFEGENASRHEFIIIACQSLEEVKGICAAEKIQNA